MRVMDELGPAPTVGALREWLTQFPDETLLMVDDEARGYAYPPASVSGPWRIQENAGHAFDYWQDNESSAREFAETHPSVDFSALPTGIVVFPR